MLIVWSMTDDVYCFSWHRRKLVKQVYRNGRWVEVATIMGDFDTVRAVYVDRIILDEAR